MWAELCKVAMVVNVHPVTYKDKLEIINCLSKIWDLKKSLNTEKISSVNFTELFESRGHKRLQNKVSPNLRNFVL